MCVIRCAPVHACAGGGDAGGAEYKRGKRFRKLVKLMDSGQAQQVGSNRQAGKGALADGPRRATDAPCTQASLLCTFGIWDAKALLQGLAKIKRKTCTVRPVALTRANPVRIPHTCVFNSNDLRHRLDTLHPLALP